MDAQFSWPEDSELPPRCRHCLFLTCSYRDNPVFLLTVTSEACSETWLKAGQIQDREHFEIVGSKYSLI